MPVFGDKPKDKAGLLWTHVSPRFDLDAEGGKDFAIWFSEATPVLMDGYSLGLFLYRLVVVNTNDRSHRPFFIG